MKICLQFAMLAGSGRSDDCARVVVTGRASGTGPEIVRAIAAQKAKVFVCDIDAKALTGPCRFPEIPPIDKKVQKAS